jgi:hypothetical protein
MLGEKASEIATSIYTFFSEAFNTVATIASTVWDTIVNVFTVAGQVLLAIVLVAVE